MLAGRRGRGAGEQRPRRLPCPLHPLDPRVAIAAQRSAVGLVAGKVRSLGERDDMMHLLCRPGICRVTTERVTAQRMPRPKPQAERLPAAATADACSHRERRMLLAARVIVHGATCHVTMSIAVPGRHQCRAAGMMAWREWLIRHLGLSASVSLVLYRDRSSGDGVKQIVRWREMVRHLAARCTTLHHSTHSPKSTDASTDLCRESRQRRSHRDSHFGCRQKLFPKRC